MTGLSRRKFAALPEVGCSLTLVQRLVKAGVLPTDPDGSIPRAAGIAAWRARGGNQAAEEGGGATPADTAAQQALSRDLRQAQLSDKQQRAALTEMKVERLRGSLVPVAEVRAEAARAAAEVRGKLLAISGGLALELESMMARGCTAAEIQAVVDREINAALAVLHSGRFVAPGETST